MTLEAIEPALWFALPLLAALLLHPGWTEGRGHPDENYHLKILAESINGDTLAFPTLKGKPWFTKPPLLLWLAAAIDPLTGLGHRAGIRIMAILGWAISYASAYGILRLSVPSVRRASVQALAAVAGFGVLWFARIGMMDLPLLANLLGACLLTSRWAGSGFKRGPALALAAVLALGGWWKGPVFYPLMVIPFFASIDREQWVPALKALLRTWYLWLAVFLVGNAWILINLAKYEWVYFRKFFFRENLSRLKAVKPLRLVIYFLLGLFPFWWPLLKTLARNPAVWLQQASGRIGLGVAVSTVLVFGMGADKHFHWFIPAYVGLSLIPWPENVFRRWLLAPLLWTLAFSVVVYQAIPAAIRAPEIPGQVCVQENAGDLAVPLAAGESRVTTLRGGLTPVGREIRALARGPGADSWEAFKQKLSVHWRCSPTQEPGSP